MSLLVYVVIKSVILRYFRARFPGCKSSRGLTLSLLFELEEEQQSTMYDVIAWYEVSLVGLR